MGFFDYIAPRKGLGPVVGLVLLCCQLIGVREASGQIAVVVNKGNEIKSVTLQSLQDIYARNKVSWRNNHKIFPVSMKSKLEVTQSFFEKALGKTPREIKRAWIRLTLSGASAPPKVVGSEAEVLLYVAKNEGAIGFVGVDKVNDSVKVLAVQGKLPSEKGYLLKSVQQR